MLLDIGLKSVIEIHSIELIPVTLLFLQMKEFFDGSGIYWYSSQRSICSACTKWEEYVNLVVDIFFSKEVLQISCARGLNKGRKLRTLFPFVSL